MASTLKSLATDTDGSAHPSGHVLAAQRRDASRAGASTPHQPARARAPRSGSGNLSTHSLETPCAASARRPPDTTRRPARSVGEPIKVCGADESRQEGLWSARRRRASACARMHATLTRDAHGTLIRWPPSVTDASLKPTAYLSPGARIRTHTSAGARLGSLNPGLRRGVANPVAGAPPPCLHAPACRLPSAASSTSCIF